MHLFRNSRYRIITDSRKQRAWSIARCIYHSAIAHSQTGVRSLETGVQSWPVYASSRIRFFGALVQSSSACRTSYMCWAVRQLTRSFYGPDAQDACLRRCNPYRQRRKFPRAATDRLASHPLHSPRCRKAMYQTGLGIAADVRFQPEEVHQNSTVRFVVFHQKGKSFSGFP